MPKTTTNHGFKKPLYSDNADIAVLNENFEAIDTLLTPTVLATEEPGTETKGKLSIVLGWIANRIKAITGTTSWQAAPPVTLSECKEHLENGMHPNATTSKAGFMSATDKATLNNASANATVSTLMKRDSYGRAKVSAPSSSSDIANKEYVDSNFVSKKYTTTMEARLVAQSNTAYTTKQVRNIVFWTSGTTPPATSNGDVVIKTF